MGQFLGVVLLWAAVTAARAAGQEETVHSLAPDEDVAAATEVFQARLAAALEAAERSRRAWKLLVWQELRCYEPGAVRESLARLQAAAREAGRADDRLAGLEGYLGRRLAGLGRMPAPMSIRQADPVTGAVESVPGVSADAADRVWDELVSAVKGLLATPQLAVDVRLHSAPEGAEVRLSARGRNDPKVAVATNTLLRNVWRGVYTATVELAGHKPARTDIDLVNQGNVAIACRLVRSGSGESSRCSLGPW